MQWDSRWEVEDSSWSLHVCSITLTAYCADFQIGTVNDVKTVVVSISPQSTASVAAAYNLSAREVITYHAHYICMYWFLCHCRLLSSWCLFLSTLGWTMCLTPLFPGILHCLKGTRITLVHL
jgi:hypothetical protein